MSDQFENDGPYQDAVSAEEIERRIMDSTFPKTSMEWWARGEIESLRARIAELEELLTEPLYASEHYVLNKTYKKYANDKVGRITVSFGWMRRLHAALNGEK